MFGNRFQREVSRFLLGSPCCLCHQRSPAALCPACTQEVLHTLEWRTVRLPGLPVYALGSYEEGLRQALQGLKYQQAQELGWWLGVQLGKAWRQHCRPQRQHCVVSC
jgi:predicted amidophosphoribosyltransferase